MEMAESHLSMSSSSSSSFCTYLPPHLLPAGQTGKQVGRRGIVDAAAAAAVATAAVVLKKRCLGLCTTLPTLLIATYRGQHAPHPHSHSLLASLSIVTLAPALDCGSYAARFRSTDTRKPTRQSAGTTQSCPAPCPSLTNHGVWTGGAPRGPGYVVPRSAYMILTFVVRRLSRRTADTLLL